jgi:hypothetical protein
MIIFQGNISFLVYQKEASNNDPVKENEAQISLRTEEFRLTINKVLILKNIVFEGGNAHLSANSDCLKTILGRCLSMNQLDSPSSECFLKEIFRLRLKENLETHPLFKLEGEELELIVEKVTFSGMKYNSLFGFENKINRLKASFIFVLANDVFFTKGVVNIIIDRYDIENEADNLNSY